MPAAPVEIKEYSVHGMPPGTPATVYRFESNRRLPSERELALRFQVSRMTARQATTGSAAPLLAGQRPRQSLTLPERPQLAPGIRPAGQMPDSGYKDPPWLLEREGAGYVQVTELLYRIAERCDGRHTAAAIALEVSDATARTVSEDNVRQLLEGQFLAKGLVVASDGTVLQPPASARSLLAIRMRQRAVPAEAVRRLFDVPPDPMPASRTNRSRRSIRSTRVSSWKHSSASTKS